MFSWRPVGVGLAVTEVCAASAVAPAAADPTGVFPVNESNQF